MLVLVVLPVLDPWDFGAEKRARSFGIVLFHHFDHAIYRILEDEHAQEHEHDFSTSALNLNGDKESPYP